LAPQTIGELFNFGSAQKSKTASFTRSNAASEGRERDINKTNTRWDEIPDDIKAQIQKIKNWEV
jgi:hypothetical protein